jgi:hypothetical protein
MSTVSTAGSGDMRVTGAGMALSRGRLGGLSGIAFVVLAAVGTFIAPVPPKASDSVEKISNYFADHRGAILTGIYLQGIGMVAVLLFVGTLAGLLRDLEGGRGPFAVGSTGAAFITGAVVTAGNALTVALAFTGRDGDAATTRVLFNFYQAFATELWFPITAWIVAASIVYLRASGPLRWIGYLGLVDGVLGLLTGASVARDGFFALGGILGLLAFALFLLWVIATSIVMLRQGEAPMKSAS